VNVESAQVTSEVIGDTVYDEPGNVVTGTLSLTDATQYSELEFRTRDLPPIPDVCDEIAQYYYAFHSQTANSVPVAYDKLAKHDYFNINIATNEVTNGIFGENPQSDSRISLNVNQVMETKL